MFAGNLKRRGFAAVNLKQFETVNAPDYIGHVYPTIVPKVDKQYVLRMLIKETHGEFKVPAELKWVNPIVSAAYNNQMRLGIKQPYCYLTVRHGIVESVTDDEWHVDGFSTNITHLPEQSYAWANLHPTEFVLKVTHIPTGFDPMKHNLQYLLQDSITTEELAYSFGVGAIMGFDPYVIHRRPNVASGTRRTFVRVSFTPILIADDCNTPNPLLPTQLFNREGVKDFRNKLIRYTN